MPSLVSAYLLVLYLMVVSFQHIKIEAVHFLVCTMHACCVRAQILHMGFSEPLSTAVSVQSAFSGQCNKWQNQYFNMSGQIEKSRGNAGWGFMEIEYIFSCPCFFLTLGHRPTSAVSAKWIDVACDFLQWRCLFFKGIFLF